MVPNAYISLHDVSAIAAHADTYFSTPLMLSIDGAHGKLRLAVFFKGASADYVNRLAEAINGVKP